MHLIQIYKCLCDESRLRILHLLSHGSLCVCHFQSILNLGQVQISKHLAFLRTRGMVEAQRHGQWMIYQLPPMPTKELELQLRCLQDCVQSHPIFRQDLKQLKKIKSECAWIDQAITATDTKR